jgi:hypothetical protein
VRNRRIVLRSRPPCSRCTHAPLSYSRVRPADIRSNLGPHQPATSPSYKRPPSGRPNFPPNLPRPLLRPRRPGFHRFRRRACPPFPCLSFRRAINRLRRRDNDPSSARSVSPSELPSIGQSATTSGSPSAPPSNDPSSIRSVSPSELPSRGQSATPSGSPSTPTSNDPSSIRSVSPSELPSSGLSADPLELLPRVQHRRRRRDPDQAAMPSLSSPQPPHGMMIMMRCPA